MSAVNAFSNGKKTPQSTVNSINLPNVVFFMFLDLLKKGKEMLV